VCYVRVGQGSVYYKFGVDKGDQPKKGVEDRARV
jgi:hypothetical protein